MLKKCNMATEAVPNAILNDIPTELVPNKIEHCHQAAQIAYRMASLETGNISPKRWSLTPHSDRYHCWLTSHGDGEDFLKSYHIKPLTETLTEWCTKGSKPIAKRHTKLNAKSPYPRPAKWLQRNKWIFYRIYLPRWWQREAAHKTLPNAK